MSLWTNWYKIVKIVWNLSVWEGFFISSIICKTGIREQRERLEERVCKEMIFKSAMKDRGIDRWWERRWWLWWGDMRRMRWTRRTVNTMRLTEWIKDLDVIYITKKCPLLLCYSMSVVGCAVCRSNYFKNFTGYDSCLPCGSYVIENFTFSSVATVFDCQDEVISIKSVLI